MAELLKNIYNADFYQQLATVLTKCLPDFDQALFTELIFSKDWPEKKLKERMKHTSHVLHHFMPPDFMKAAKILTDLVAQLQQAGIEEETIEYMFIPDYIEKYGLDDFEPSVRLMATVTQFTSCEYAVRPFLRKYGSQMIGQMRQWSTHPHDKVRRLASEGSRPRLPWGLGVAMLKEDPSLILPILENLKTDPSLVVRRSVANNLNDIAKDHPDFVLAIMQEWRHISPETNWIIRHGSRTLLKKANPKALQYYGLKDDAALQLHLLELSANQVRVGESLQFSFTLINQRSDSRLLRLEYGIDYLLANDRYNRKIYQISERTLQPKEQVAFSCKRSFKPITTRKFYPGLHHLVVIVNGAVRQKLPFMLVDNRAT